MKDEAIHYFKLAIKRLQNHAQKAGAAQNTSSESSSDIDSKQAVTFFLLELLKEQVPNEDSSSTTR